MSSTVITGELGRLRRRERLLAVTWGVARWLALGVLCVLTVAALDWWIERRQETPRWLREMLTVVQIVALAVAGLAWVIRPALRRRSDDALALFIESRRPHLAHRLISAVQLGRGGCGVEQMSSDLIDAVIREAEAEVRLQDITRELDHRRFRWAGLLAGGSLVILAAFAVTEMGFALVSRQLLVELELPRRVQIEDRTAPVQPGGEPAELRFVVAGEAPLTGEVRWWADGDKVQRLPIDSVPLNGDVRLLVPAATSDFDYEVSLGDGRLKQPGRVRFVTRPAVVELNATLLLPEYVGRRPDGSRHGRTLPTGDVSGITGCAVSLAVRMQNDVARAEIEFLGRSDLTASTSPQLVRRVDMRLASPREAYARFDLHADELAYRVVVADAFGFRNLDPPRREIHLLAEDPPIVKLLPEHFKPLGEHDSTLEEFEVDGVPVPLGAAVRVAYSAHHDYGLGRAYFVYRLTPGPPQYSRDGTPPDLSPRPVDGEWKKLELAEATVTPQTGPFDLRRGCFVQSRVNDQVQFYPGDGGQGGVPRLEGGGRFDFQTRALTDVRVGDVLEYYIEVTSLHPSKPIAGRSESRVKKIVTVEELVEWIDGTLRQEDRIRRLADRQRSVFETEQKPERR